MKTKKSNVWLQPVSMLLVPKFLVSVLLFAIIQNVYAISIASTSNTLAGNILDKNNIIDLTTPIVATVGSVAFRECHLNAQGRDRKVQCAWVEVAEDPEQSEGTTIHVFVVRIPAKRSFNSSADPLLFLAGGPGQAASDAFLFADHIWAALAKKRDFYLIDQRGTGYSNNLGCEHLLDNFETAGQAFNLETVKHITQKCLKSLPNSVALYTTDNSVKDFETVREALGIKQWNLLGVSYGTRVATHYMRSQPDHLRTVVLDSVIPPEHTLGVEISRRSQNSLDDLYARCTADEQCNQAIPHLEQHVNSILQQLNQAPIDIEIENFNTGAIEDIQFTRQHLAILIRMYLYNPSTLALLPPMLKQAAVSQNYAPLARAAKLTTQSLSGAMSIGLHNTVMCTEEFPFFPTFKNEEHPDKNTYLGTDLFNSIAVACSVWPKGKITADMKAPLESAIPTLLLSGQYDPITPPAYAEQTLQHLSNAKHLELKGQGHFVSSAGCAPNIIDNFINAMSVEGLKTDCLSRLNDSPLFINFNSTAP